MTVAVSVSIAATTHVTSDRGQDPTKLALDGIDLGQAVSDPVRRHLQQIAPLTAGLAIQSTTNLRSLPIAPWPGLGVLAAWAAVTLLTGGLLLSLRDA